MIEVVSLTPSIVDQRLATKTTNVRSLLLKTFEQNADHTGFIQQYNPVKRFGGVALARCMGTLNTVRATTSGNKKPAATGTKPHWH